MASNASTIRRADRDLYAMLGVAPEATADEINAAFRARAKELHPDAAPDDAGAPDELREARFKELSEAYATLTNGERRAAYDARRAQLAPPVPTAPKPRSHQVLTTRGRARAAIVAGIVCVLLGAAISPVLLSIETSPDTLGRDVTLWIVVAKLVICGLILVGFGWWRLAVGFQADRPVDPDRPAPTGKPIPTRK